MSQKVLIALSSLGGVIIGIIAQFIINYKLIEYPKLELERKKNGY